MCCVKQSFEQQIVVFRNLVLTIGDDALGHAACRNEMGGLGEGWQEFIDQTVDHGRRAIKDATLHTLQGVAPDEMTWLLYVDSRKL